MKPTFENSLKVLVQAFFNGTLQRSNCHACAVGNFVAAANNLCYTNSARYPEKKIYQDDAEPRWQEVFISGNPGEQSLCPDAYNGEAKRQIDSTGYTWQDLARIELAFEAAPFGDTDDQSMFNGLMAVVDILAEIHGVDLTTKESAKALFVKTPSL